MLLNNKIINIGEWDYQYKVVDGKQIAHNPLPTGAIIEEREFEYSEERGWREVGVLPLPTDKERIDMLENMMLIMLEG